MATLAALSKTIADNVALLERHLSAQNNPGPSFAADSPALTLPPDLLAARDAIIDATSQLRCLVLGPADYIMSHKARPSSSLRPTPTNPPTQHDDLLSLQAISRFDLPGAVPLDAPTPYAAVAAARGLAEDDTRRLLRHAVARHIFTEPRPGHVAHNAVSAALVAQPALLDWAGAMANDLWPGAARALDAMQRWPGSQEPHESGFSLANDTDKSVYQVFDADPARARRFGSAMTLYASAGQYDEKHLVQGYDWAKLGDALVVDIGGSHGAICAALATAYPQLRFVVQDLPQVIATAPPLAAALAPRIELMPHDFFTPQPVHGADVYLIRWTLHNWSDKYVLAILRQLLPALKPGARVIINDGVLPAPGTLPGWQEMHLRSLDLTMKEMQNAKERDLDEFRALMAQVDARLVFRGAAQPKGSTLSIVEFEWVP